MLQSKGFTRTSRKHRSVGLQATLIDDIELEVLVESIVNTEELKDELEELELDVLLGVEVELNEEPDVLLGVEVELELFVELDVGCDVD